MPHTDQTTTRPTVMPGGAYHYCHRIGGVAAIFFRLFPTCRGLSGREDLARRVKESNPRPLGRPGFLDRFEPSVATRHVTMSFGD